MALSTVVRVRRDGKTTLTDGVRSQEIAYENGNVTFNVEKAERIVIRDRGTIVGVRLGDSPVLTISFDVHQRLLTTNASGDYSLIDLIDNTGAVNGVWTKASAAIEPWNLNQTFTIEGTDHGDNADTVATFTHVVYSWSFKEGDPNSVPVTGEFYGGYSATGPT